MDEIGDHRLLDDLDDEQRQAVSTESRLVAVVAGAGSGKTRVLTRRVAYRVASGDADPRHTLVLTFTREAAGELRRRLPRLGLRADAATGVTTGTFHSVAHSVLQQRWRDLGQRPRTLTPDRRSLITQLPRARGVDLDALVAEIEWAAARRLTASTYETALRRSDHRCVVEPGDVVAALDAYARAKRERGVIDLDDLLTVTIDSIEGDASFADAIRWRFRHLHVDEAQDLNPLQHRLIDLMREGRDDLFLVGDPAQAIYGFNGADPALLVDVADRFPGVEIVRLSSNYRSTAQIVDAGAYALRATGADVLEARSVRGDGAVVSVVEHADEHAEATAVATMLRHIDPPLLRRNQIAVLARTNAQLALLRSAVDAAGVPVRADQLGEARRRWIAQVFRLSDPHDVRRWAQDALEQPDTADADASDADAADPTRAEVARALLDFLRTDPTGDGRAFRAWVESTDPFGATTHGVELLTFHAAKGREWHTVALIGCETSLVPHRSATTAATRAEETRLLYVAMTRATDRLTINWARRRGGYQRRRTPFLDGFVSEPPPVMAPPPALVSAGPSAHELLLGQLRAWRSRTARRRGLLPEAVCSDAALAAIARERPASAAELDDVTGLGTLTAARLFDELATLYATVTTSDHRS